MDPHSVVVLVRPGVLPLELGIAHQLFGRAESDGVPLYDVTTCALRPGVVAVDADYSITVQHGPELLEHAQTVIVPGSHDPAATDETGQLDDDLAAALDRVPANARIASICTGSFVLAAAGLLDGKRATTHWKSVAAFRQLFPAVDVDPRVLYTDEGRVLTSAGEAAGIDLCLHMIRCDHGAAVANAVARTTVVPPHREGGQAQFIPRPVPEPTVASTAAAREWAMRNLGSPVSLRDLAAHGAMSVRTFTRRFREETGMSAWQWLTQQRIERARQLLEESDWSVDRIAAEAGFGTATSLRQHLQAALGTSPSAYRRTFTQQP